jgi:hypothetical protein
MKETVNFNLTTLDKVNYLSTINTSFNQLGVINLPPPDPTSDESVAEFFDLYNQLFYQIPERGPDLSHEYLIKQSSQYINFEQNDENIQALQDEIAVLREERARILSELGLLRARIREIDDERQKMAQLNKYINKHTNSNIPPYHSQQSMLSNAPQKVAKSKTSNSDISSHKTTFTSLFNDRTVPALNDLEITILPL